MTDLLIVGAGPAGLATALYAHRAGMTVTVLDKRISPIDKACGEGLMPGAVRELAQLGVHPQGVEFRGIRYRSGTAVAEAVFRDGPGLGVRRTELHRALSERVAEQGIPVVQRAVHDFWHGSDGVSVGTLTADWLVAADGLHSPIRAAAGLRPQHRFGNQQWLTPKRFGQRRHYALAPWTDLVEVYWSAHGEAYVTPVGPDLVGVAVLGASGTSYDDQLRHFPELAARLDGVEAGPVRGAGPLLQRVRRRVAGRVLLVGDAAGYVDALTGEGIWVAMRSARELIRCLVAGRPQDYERAWRRASRSYRGLTSVMLAATRVPPMRRRLVPAAARVPAVFSAAVNLLAR